MGGLSKKAFQLEKMQRENTGPALILDSGNLLFKTERLAEGLARQQAEITAAGIVLAYNQMGFDAVGVGRNDLAGGLDFLKKLRDQSEFPWLSANLVSTTTGKTIFKKSIIKNIGGIRVGIVALTGRSQSLPDDVRILPWQDVLEPLVKSISKTCDLVVLLSNNPVSVNREIAQSVPGVHLIIQADPRSANLTPELVNNTLICQTGKQGKYLGMLAINWHKSKVWGTDELGKRLKLKQRELEGITARINRYINKLSQEELKNSQIYKSLIKDRDRVSQQEDSIIVEIRRRQADNTTPSTYTNSFTALEISMPDQPQVLKIVEQIKRDVNRVSDTTKTTTTGTEKTGTVAGWQVCMSCHDSKVTAWEKTPHAKAYKTLVEKGQNNNLECLPCHVTGGKEIDLNMPEDLKSVSCEVCHGAGKRHAENPAATKMNKTPNRELCMGCHTPDRDDDFDYGVKLNKVSHAEPGALNR